MTTILKQQLNDNIISNINDFIIGDTSYWKLKYTESVEKLNHIIDSAKDEFEYHCKCSFENTHLVSFHLVFMDMIRDHFEIVKCKQINGYRILKVMKKIMANITTTMMGMGLIKIFKNSKIGNIMSIA